GPATHCPPIASRVIFRALSAGVRGGSGLVPFQSGSGPRPHRLEAQDIALSRREQGFESPWGRQLFFCGIPQTRTALRRGFFCLFESFSPLPAVTQDKPE